MLQCRPQIISVTIFALITTLPNNTHLFKTGTSSLDVLYICLCTCEYTFVTMYVCVWRSYIPTAGMPRPLLRMWRILTAPKGCASVFVCVFIFLVVYPCISHSACSSSAKHIHLNPNLIVLDRFTVYHKYINIWWIQAYRYSQVVRCHLTGAGAHVSVARLFASGWWVKQANYS